MVANEEVGVLGYLGLSRLAGVVGPLPRDMPLLIASVFRQCMLNAHSLLTHSWRLAVVRELQDVDHVLAFLFLDVLPGDVWYVFEGGSHRVMVVSVSISSHSLLRCNNSLPSHSL